MMKKRSLVLAAALLAVVGPAALADKPTDNGSGVPPGQPFQALQDQIDALRGELGETFVAKHYQKLLITIDPGGQNWAPVRLPRANRPVRIEVSLSFRDGTLISPSELMSAVVNFDPHAGAMTWIGTDSNGDTHAWNTMAAPASNVIANICGDSTCSSSNVVANLQADPAIVAHTFPHGSLVLTQLFTDSGAGYYIVELWY